MKIKKILDKRNNNIDLIRFIAACMVIYGHSFSLSRVNNEVDLIREFVDFDYSGSLAVKTFFFVSGLIVANSLLIKKDISRFIISRAFRIIPGLLTVLLITSLIIGPLTSSLPSIEYYSNSATYKYITNNLIFKTEYYLPGVFEHNKYPKAVNGSLWTLAYEMGFYITLLSIFVLGGLRNSVIPGLIFATIVIDPILQNKILFTWRTPNADIDYLAPSFTFGVFCAIMKEKIDIKPSTIISAFSLYYFLRNSTYALNLFYFSFFLLILYLSSLTWIVKLKLKHDLSYGIYLWGFPIQQCIFYYYPSYSLYQHFLTSILISIFFSWMMFVFVEKPSISLGQKISLALSRPCKTSAVRMNAGDLG